MSAENVAPENDDLFELEFEELKMQDWKLTDRIGTFLVVTKLIAVEAVESRVAFECWSCREPVNINE